MKNNKVEERGVLKREGGGGGSGVSISTNGRQNGLVIFFF